jgi:hypothetical protein
MDWSHLVCELPYKARYEIKIERRIAVREDDEEEVSSCWMTLTKREVTVN